MNNFEVNFLHITDLHVGMTDQGWLWPEMKYHLYDDIARQHDRMSKLDFVIFSGDLVQRGIRAEFDRLDEILHELWSKFGEIGSNPVLFHIPGNHDLKRPDVEEPNFLALGNYWESESVRTNVFANKYGYKESITDIFGEYVAWSERISKSKTVPTSSSITGIFPGDKSCVVEIHGVRVGIVGLNSTWLQFLPGDQKGRMCLDVRQLHAVTRNDPRKWCNANDINLIVTHHPTDWLHSISKANWISDINPELRFDAHFYGHMHESEVQSQASFGSAARTTVQGMSLFGLEYVDGEQTKRLNGYSLCRIYQSDGRQRFKIWPRALRKLGSGEFFLGQDIRFKLNEDNSFLAFDREVTATEVKKKINEIVALPVLQELKTISGQSILSKLRYHLPQARNHSAIRAFEKDEFRQRIEQNRFCWLIADWGMAGDEFLSVALADNDGNGRACFRIDASDYSNKDAFLDDIKERYSISFEKICDALEEFGPCCLIIDGIPTDNDVRAGRVSISNGLEDLVAIALQYCTNLIVVLRQETAVDNADVSAVKLRSLDEADLSTYIRSFGDKYAEIFSESAIRKLHQYTDGVPHEIDAALKNLSLVPLSELVSSNSDLIASAVSRQTRENSRSYHKSLDLLITRSKEEGGSELDLLRTLSVFPKGEQLSRVKRFRHHKNFYVEHASELLRLGLIDVSTDRSAELGSTQEATRTLFVPKPIRDTVVQTLGSEQFYNLNRRAAALYFGDEWESGIFRPPSSYAFDNPHCGNFDIINANSIITRLMIDALNHAGDRELDAALGLAITYSYALMRGDHFGGVVIFLEDFLRLTPSHSSDGRRAQLELIMAQGLRMIGAHDRAIKLTNEICADDLTNINKQHRLLNLILCHEKTGEESLIPKLCNELVSINRSSPVAWQAKSVLLRLQPPSSDRSKKLRILEAYCRKNGAESVANEIALTRADDRSLDPGEVASLLAPVISSTSDKNNFYARLRAFVRISRISMDERRELGSVELDSLIMAYHFLFNERLSVLFDRCHDLLWAHFEATSDEENLFRLFRHSSLYWRLRGRTDQEKRYLSRPKSAALRNVVAKDESGRREISYFKLRMSELLPLPEFTPTEPGNV